MTRETLPISVVVATRNRPALLRDTVASIADGSAVPAEVIVVDQSDPPVVAHDWSVPAPVAARHLAMAPRGVSAARNLGARAARTAVLAFVDDDVCVAREWLSSMMREKQAAGPSAAVTGRVIAGSAERPGGFVYATVDRERRVVYAGRLPMDVLAGGNMAIDRDSFLRVGGFDERLGPGTAFPAAEDNDLGYRLLHAGFRIIYTPEAVAVHRAWRSASEYSHLRYAYGVGKGAFYLKHLHTSDWHMAGRLTQDLLRRGARTVRFAAHPRRALGEVAYAAGVVAGACSWVLQRPGAVWPAQETTHDA
jgi:GT2 family glycosyltransferase